MYDSKSLDFRNRRMLLKSLAVMISLPLYHRLSLASPAWDVTSFDAISFDVFVEHVEQILNENILDVGMTKHIYRLLQDEPWGMSHLQRVLHKLSQVKTADAVFALLDKGEHWFLGHLITTWVTGIYYHEQGDVMVSYQHALMHEALEDIRPIPGFSEEKFGFWHKPPANMSIRT